MHLSAVHITLAKGKCHTRKDVDGFCETGIAELHEGVLASHLHVDAVVVHLQGTIITSASLTQHSRVCPIG